MDIYWISYIYSNIYRQTGENVSHSITSLGTLSNKLDDSNIDIYLEYMNIDLKKYSNENNAAYS